MIRPVIAITHAAFDEARRASYERLKVQLHDCAPDIEFIGQIDTTRLGSLECWRLAMRSALDLHPDATHIVWLPDDAILSKGFGKALRRMIAARPEDVFDCAANHAAADKLVSGWYTTPEGFHGNGGCFPRALLEEHLAWRDAGPGWNPAGHPAYLANDRGVNVWAMATGRLIHKPVVSIVDHDDSIPSLDGNDAHEWRRAPRFTDNAADLDGWHDPSVALSRTYEGNCWDPLWMQEHWGRWDPEWSFRAFRGGRPVSLVPHVMIAVPSQRAVDEPIRQSIYANKADLEAHGINVTLLITPGDSLVTRARHCIQHEFLSSICTHLLQWDDDVECLDRSAVRGMLLTGHDIVGGAYPWRDGSGRTVVNPLPETLASQRLDIDHARHCFRVSDLGTGFLMTSRKALLTLCKAHPELMYEADIEPYRGATMWALFDANVEPQIKGERRRYASEDWRFCSLARAAGIDVHCYYPPFFRHWGKKAHEGHITKDWGMKNTQEVAEVLT